MESEERGGLRSLSCATRAQGCLKLQGRRKKRMARQGPSRSQNAGRRKTKRRATEASSGPR